MYPALSLAGMNKDQVEKGFVSAAKSDKFAEGIWKIGLNPIRL